MLNYPPTHSCYLKLFYNLTDPTITLTLAFREAIPKVHFFLALFKKPLTPPHSFEHYVVNFSEGILTKVR